jgi:ketopantoate hydroxymethyltransferase
VAPVLAHMGLTPEAWQEFRVGERAVAPVLTHMGLTPEAWLAYRAGEQVA